MYHEKVIVVRPNILADQQNDARDPEACLAEAVALTRAIRLDVQHAEIIPIKKMNPATLIGKGVVERLKAKAAETEAKLFVFDHALTPIQQRNLEKELGAKVIDRVGLILEIFGDRARTHEGSLQVELVSLTYQRSRLVRSWTHLERQRGGFGFLGGPGESQIELDRRLIDTRITKIKKELQTVEKRRGQQRKARKRVPYPTVALVGYTNSGKSTLFNALTGAKVMAEDLLFATLDPTLRAIKLPSGRKVILSDTVGFISDLPTHLISAFRATLEEVVEADLIVHVRDAVHPDTAIQKSDVLNVLRSLSVSDEKMQAILEVQNKIDCLTKDQRESLARTSLGISALREEGLEKLLEKIDAHFDRTSTTLTVVVSVTDGKLLAWIYEHTQVLERQDAEDAITLKVRVQPNLVDRLTGEKKPRQRDQI